MRVADLLLACLLLASFRSAAAAQDPPPADDAAAPTVAEALEDIAPAGDGAAASGSGLKEVNLSGGSRIKTVNLESRAPRAGDAAAEDAAGSGGDASLAARLDEVAARARADDLDGAARLLQDVLAAPDFATLPPAAQIYALTSAGWLADRDGDHAQALLMYRRAAAVPEATADVLQAHAQAASIAGEHDEAATALHALLSRFPQSLAVVDDWLVEAAVAESTRGTETRIALLQLLADGGYVLQQDRDGSFVGYELALERLAAHDDAAAKAALATVTAPEEIAKIVADRRFDAIVDAGDPRYDVERAARRRVDDLRTRALLDQDVLALQASLAEAMNVVGEAENTVALAEEVEAAFAESPEPGYRDSEQRALMIVMHVQALVMLERSADAEAVLAAAGGPGADQRLFTTQILLGALQCVRGKPAEALATLAAVGEQEHIMEMLRQSFRLCAAVQLEDAAAGVGALAWIRANRAVDEGLHTEALLWTGHIDEAAATLVERLQSPALRGDALLDLQQFREEPELPGERVLRAAWDTVRARADVEAAIAEVGRVHEYSIYMP